MKSDKLGQDMMKKRRIKNKIMIPIKQGKMQQR